MKALVILAAIIVIAPFAHAEKRQNFERGTVVESQRDYRMFGKYTISAGDTTYYVEERLVKVRLIPLTPIAHLTVNGSIDFRVLGNRLKFFDDDGKEHSAIIVHQVVGGAR